MVRGQKRSGDEGGGKREGERVPLMAVASKKRFHRNYCTIVIPRVTLANSCGSLSLDWRALHNVKCSSVERGRERAKRMHGAHATYI